MVEFLILIWFLSVEGVFFFEKQEKHEEIKKLALREAFWRRDYFWFCFSVNYLKQKIWKKMEKYVKSAGIFCKNSTFANISTLFTVENFIFLINQILSINSFATAAYSRDPLPYGSW